MQFSKQRYALADAIPSRHLDSLVLWYSTSGDLLPVLLAHDSINRRKASSLPLLDFLNDDDDNITTLSQNTSNAKVWIHSTTDCLPRQPLFRLFSFGFPIYACHLSSVVNVYRSVDTVPGWLADHESVRCPRSLLFRSLRCESTHQRLAAQG